jgi:hypothetical protein
MKSLLLAVSLIVSMNVFAKKIEIERTYSGHYSTLSGQFAINEELGRAWIDFSGSFYDAEMMPDTFRVKINGLSFDKTKSQIVFNDGEKSSNCADVRIGTSIFKPTKLKPTKACFFSQEVETKMVDDGFEIKKVSYDVLYLNVL